MEDKIKERTLREKNYFLYSSRATLRSTANHFGEVSKSTVHRDLTKRLKYYSPEWAKVQFKLQKNKSKAYSQGAKVTKNENLEK